MKPLNLKTGPRVLSSFAIVLFVMACITAVALWRLHAANETTEFLVNDKLAKQQLAADWLGAAKLNGVRALSIAKSDSLEVGEFFQAQLVEGDKLIASTEKQLLGLSHSPDEDTLLRSASEKEKAYLAVRKEIFGFKELGKTQEVEQLADTTFRGSGRHSRSYAQGSKQPNSSRQLFQSGRNYIIKLQRRSVRGSKYRDCAAD